jgi:Undecaprenyl-phosphate galactose phosphotransferase WbaP
MSTSELNFEQAARLRGGDPLARWSTALPALDSSRLFDLVVATLLLTLIAPLMAALAVLVTLQDGGSPVYGHLRIGRGGKSFRCWKYRSMVRDSDARLRELLANDPAARTEWERDQKLRHDPRVTRLGAFLRSSSLDELPQLLNVLRGEMSLVGPRPIVQEEVYRYGRHFHRYCSVRPGLTGLWQVSGRNDVGYRRRVVMDVAYARKHSLRLNIAIMLATVPAVLWRRGSY